MVGVKYHSLGDQLPHWPPALTGRNETTLCHRPARAGYEADVGGLEDYYVLHLGTAQSIDHEP
jgi:hypothetical protein